MNVQTESHHRPMEDELDTDNRVEGPTEQLSKSFHGIQVDLFNRSHHVVRGENGSDNRYEMTAIKAADPNYMVADDPTTAQTSTNGSSTSPTLSTNAYSQSNSYICRLSSPILNIFGNNCKFYCNRDRAGHLMPLSKRCATMWFHFVPWIVYTSNTTETTSSRIHDNDDKAAQWDYMQKCIHGFVSVKPSKDKDDSTIAVDATSGAIQDLDPSSMANPPKELEANLYGIKHFPSNQIQLYRYSIYADKYPCILIVPILDVADIRNWKGEPYDAIILAGNWDDKYNIKASDVCRSIEASYGNIVFADMDECNTALSSIQQMILCVCKSFHDNYIQFIEPLVEQFNPKEQEMLRSTFSQLHTTGRVPIPVNKSWPNPMKGMVRKISFSAAIDTEPGNNPAPDPTLLLGKAASVWLRRQSLFILPCFDYDEPYSSGNSVNDDSLISNSKRNTIREWPSNTYNKKLNEIILDPSDTIDNDLSDLDD